YYIVEDGEGKLGKANVTVGRKYSWEGSSPGQGEPNLGRNDYYHFIEDSPPQVLDVLANDRLSPNAEIVEVSGISGIGGTVVIADDGQTLLYTLPYGKIGNASFDYTYRDTNGETGTQQVRINVDKSYEVRSDLNFSFPV